MALGEAAGMASALALASEIDYPAVDVAEVRARLGMPAFIEKTIRQWGFV